MSRISRRKFLGSSLAAGAGFMIVPRKALGGPGNTPPSEQLRIASIGTAGQAMADLGQVIRDGDPIVALADAHESRAKDAMTRFPEAKFYADWREMLDKEQNNIDAVLIACPDHIHAVAGMAAMQLGKHVYIEKPMAHNVAEVRALQAAAKKYGVVTQMGNQGHSAVGTHRLKKWIDLGAIGGVTDVKCWTNRPGWPQGIDRPADSMEVPADLRWDLWLGPAADRPYHDCYLPKKWRGWYEFGNGALGDMGCHILGPAFNALQLGAPTRITPQISELKPETYPAWEILEFEFPERGPNLPALKLTWYDGGKMFDRPEGLPEGKPMGDSDGGSLFTGDQGQAMCGTYSNNLKLLPFERMDEYEHADIEADRAREGHQMSWVNACKGKGKTFSDFDTAGPLTEAVLLGAIAARVGQPIEWDSENMKITNLPEANAYLSREYREGFGLGA
jgi:hypothetical protein